MDVLVEYDTPGIPSRNSKLTELTSFRSWERWFLVGLSGSEDSSSVLESYNRFEEHCSVVLSEV